MFNNIQGEIQDEKKKQEDEEKNSSRRKRSRSNERRLRSRRRKQKRTHKYKQYGGEGTKIKRELAKVQRQDEWKKEEINEQEDI